MKCRSNGPSYIMEPWWWQCKGRSNRIIMGTLSLLHPSPYITYKAFDGHNRIYKFGLSFTKFVNFRLESLKFSHTNRSSRSAWATSTHSTTSRTTKSVINKRRDTTSVSRKSQHIGVHPHMCTENPTSIDLLNHS